MSDQPVRFNPVGNMDKDSDPRYVRQGNYIDAKNIQKLTEKGGTGGAVIPTKGNEFAFDLGCFEPQNKKYRIKKGESDRFTVDRFNTVPKETDQEFPELSSYLTHLTLTLSSTPTFVVGDFITISGATPTELNGAFEVTSISGNDIVLNIPQNTIPAIAPTSGNSIIIGNPTIDSGVYEISFQTMNQDYVIQTVVTSGDIPSILLNLQSSTYGSQFTFTSTSEYIDIELNTFDYYDYYIESVGSDRLEIFATQEAIPVNIAGCLVANGSFDLLGDLFITSTTIEDEPEVLNLNVVQIQNNPNTTITFSTNHDFVVGEWIGITESEESWLNGTFLIDSIPNPNQIVIITSQSWNNSNVLPSIFSEVMVRNPQSIGEIGVAVYDYDADTWSYTRLIRSIQLNFLTIHANDITGRDDVRRRTLYYTDDYNNRRAFYYYGEYIEDGALSYINPDNYYTYDNIDRQSEVSSPSIEAKVVLAEQLDSGSLKSGNKRYFCYLVDYFGNRSAYSEISNVVSAYRGIPSGTIYGNDAGEDTYKRNLIRIEDIEQEKYEYIALGYIDYTGEAVTAQVLSEREITGRTMIIEHNGSETTFIVDLATITVSNLNIPKKALNVDLIDNRLVFSNLVEPSKVDLRDWSKSFKHRIKQKFISESTKYQLGEYQDVQVIHNYLGYMMNETYRFGVQVYWKKSGTWSEASWIDDILIDFKQTNESNPNNNNRREQNGNDILENYDLNVSIEGDTFRTTGNSSPVDGISNFNKPIKNKHFTKVKVPYVEFFGFDLNFEINGVPIRNLISKIKIVRAECIPEVIATGPIVMSVGMGSPGDQPGTYRTGRYSIGNYLGLSENIFNSVTIAADNVNKIDLSCPYFPLSYDSYEGDIYHYVGPKVCLSENDTDPMFDWSSFEGTFHEYPFAYGTPAQGGAKPFDYVASSRNLTAARYYPWGYFRDSNFESRNNIDDGNVNGLVGSAVSGNWRRNYYSDSVGVGNATGGFYYSLFTPGSGPDNAPASVSSNAWISGGYPTLQEYIGHGGTQANSLFLSQRICPLYHYGEDPYKVLYENSAYPGTEGFTGRHGQPFGIYVRIGNRHVTAVPAPDDPFSETRQPFYPFWVNRRIVTFYSPDILFDNEAIPSSGTLNVFGEYRMDSTRFNDVACGIFSSVNQLSGYSEYTVEGMGTTFKKYSIDDIFDIGDGGSEDIYDGATFRKSYSANAKNWNGTTAKQAIQDKPYEKYNDLWINPRSLVFKVDGDSDSSLRDGVTGIEPENKNTDYGVYYVQMFSGNKGKYGSTGDSSYIDTGYSVKVIDLNENNGIVNRNQINVFGGDTFTQSTYLAARKINPSLAPEDGNWNASTEGRIDTNGPGWGGGMKFYSQNRVNSQLRTDDDDSFLYPKDTQNQGDWLQDFTYGHGNNFRYNSSYTPKSGVLSYSSINDRLLRQQTELPSRIDYSEKYEQNTLDDKNQSFLPLNFKDIDQAFGEILSHKNVNGELFTLQPRKFQAQFFNASGTLQTESTEGLNVVIGDGAVLARDGRTLSSYGTEHKWSVIKGKSPGGKDVLYWYNQESKLIMRFGADGTVVLSDVHGLRSFLENDARWVQGKDTPYAGDGVRVVWDDEYKEAIWTWRGVRKVAKYVGGRTIVVGAIVENTNAPSDTFDNIPRLFRCTVEHNSTPNYEPGVGSDWEQVWEQIDYDNEEYYTWFTLAFNEMTNGFSSFYSHHPKIYFPWRNKFLSAHPTEENKIYEHRRGEYTTWYKTEAGELSEDAYIEGVVNYMPESSKKFVATQVISDEEPYRMEFETKRHKSHLVEGDFDDHDDHWRSPIKNDTTGGNAPDADTESLTGDYIKVKFFIEKKVYNRLYNFVIKVRERLRVYRK
jgi:hypothetical protein